MRIPKCGGIIMLWALLAIQSLAVERPSNKSGPFYDPTLGFEEAFMPILTSFEKAQIETTNRGFFVRGDYPGGFLQSDMEPSYEGLYLNVGVAEDVKALSDETKQVKDYTERRVSIPSRQKDVQD